MDFLIKFQIVNQRFVCCEIYNEADELVHRSGHLREKVELQTVKCKIETTRVIIEEVKKHRFDQEAQDVEKS